MESNSTPMACSPLRPARAMCLGCMAAMTLVGWLSKSGLAVLATFCSELLACYVRRSSDEGVMVVEFSVTFSSLTQSGREVGGQARGLHLTHSTSLDSWRWKSEPQSPRFCSSCSCWYSNLSTPRVSCNLRVHSPWHLSWESLKLFTRV